MKPMFKLTFAATLASAMFAAQAQNAVSVNGKAISSKLVDMVVEQVSQGRPASPEQRKSLISRIVDIEVVAQDAAKRGLGSKDMEMQLAWIKTQMLAEAASKDYLAKNPVSDADAKAEYDKQIKGMPAGKEYRARHILVAEEAQAKDIISKLKGGTKFEELAKLSKDTGSAAQGGDLGYANPANYVKPFADAIASLKKGELTQEPVKSEFGFHVIELTDVRDAMPPEFDGVKAQIKEGMAQERWMKYQKDLRSKAVVK